MCLINLDLIKLNLLAWKQLNKIQSKNKLVSNIKFIFESCVPQEDIVEALIAESYSIDQPISSTNSVSPRQISSKNTEGEFAHVFYEILCAFLTQGPRKTYIKTT